MEKTIVLAGNIQQFNRFIQDIGLNPKDEDLHFIYVDRIDKVIGVDVRDVIKIGTWYENKNAYELEEICISRIR